jgi:hypothetical protein
MLEAGIQNMPVCTIHPRPPPPLWRQVARTADTAAQLQTTQAHAVSTADTAVTLRKQAGCNDCCHSSDTAQTDGLDHNTGTR